MPTRWQDVIIVTYKQKREEEEEKTNVKYRLKNIRRLLK
jgi:hypothetical protein